MSDAQLGELLAVEPEDIQDEVLSINDDARDLGLQVALLVTLVAALIGIVNSFRMFRLPDPQPSTAVEGMALGRDRRFLIQGAQEPRPPREPRRPWPGGISSAPGRRSGSSLPANRGADTTTTISAQAGAAAAAAPAVARALYEFDGREARSLRQPWSASSNYVRGAGGTGLTKVLGGRDFRTRPLLGASLGRGGPLRTLRFSTLVVVLYPEDADADTGLMEAL